MKQRKTISHLIYIICEDKCILFFVLIALLSGFLLQTHPVSAAASQMPLTGYCNNPSPHCYAEVYWHRSVAGAYTEINPFGSLHCGCSSGFIDNEMWFADNTSNQCTSTPYGGCWVESGIATYTANEKPTCDVGHASTCLFWADNRPGKKGIANYTEHPVYSFGADGVSLNPYLVYIAIGYNGSLSGSVWNVSDYLYTNDTYTATFGGQSTVNQMSPDYITIGSELSTNAISADDNEFTNNQWEGSNSNWYFQTDTGIDGSTHSPPTGSWFTNPCVLGSSNCSSNAGGVYLTYD